jgi:hypothetical protein
VAVADRAAAVHRRERQTGQQRARGRRHGFAVMWRADGRADRDRGGGDGSGRRAMRMEVER